MDDEPSLSQQSTQVASLTLGDASPTKKRKLDEPQDHEADTTGSTDRGSSKQLPLSSSAITNDDPKITGGSQAVNDTRGTGHTSTLEATRYILHKRMLDTALHQGIRLCQAKIQDYINTHANDDGTTSLQHGSATALLQQLYHDLRFMQHRHEEPSCRIDNIYMHSFGSARDVMFDIMDHAPKYFESGAGDEDSGQEVDVKEYDTLAQFHRVVVDPRLELLESYIDMWREDGEQTDEDDAVDERAMDIADGHD